jgi:hypothetical protein
LLSTLLILLKDYTYTALFQLTVLGVTTEKHFLLSMHVPMGQLLVTQVPRKLDMIDCLQAARHHVGLSRSHGFEDLRMIVDQEPPLIAFIRKLPMVVVPVATAQHIQKAERITRHLKDRCQAVLASLPYKLPRRCISSLVTFVSADGFMGALSA